MNNTPLNRGEKVRVKGLVGVGTVVERWTMPGERDARVRLNFFRPRSGKFACTKTYYENECVREEA